MARTSSTRSAGLTMDLGGPKVRTDRVNPFLRLLAYMAFPESAEQRAGFIAAAYSGDLAGLEDGRREPSVGARLERVREAYYREGGTRAVHGVSGASAVEREFWARHLKGQLVGDLLRIRISAPDGECSLDRAIHALQWRSREADWRGPDGKDPSMSERHLQNAYKRMEASAHLWAGLRELVRLRNVDPTVGEVVGMAEAVLAVASGRDVLDPDRVWRPAKTVPVTPPSAALAPLPDDLVEAVRSYRRRAR